MEIKYKVRKEVSQIKNIDLLLPIMIQYLKDCGYNTNKLMIEYVGSYNFRIIDLSGKQFKSNHIHIEWTHCNKKTKKLDKNKYYFEIDYKQYF